MTRPRAAAKAFVAALPDHITSQIAVVYSPLLEIVPLRVDVPLRTSDGVVFTSANAVAHGPDGNGRSAYCVGAATTRAATTKGWAAWQCGATAEALVAHLIRTPPPQELIHLSGVHTRGDVAARLTHHGTPTRNIAVYDQLAQALTGPAKILATGAKPLIVPLFSPRSAAQFAEQVPNASAVHAITFSNAVAQSLGQASYGSVTIADTPDVIAMRVAIDAALSNLRSG
jgi:uroporphyrinogen-III synthase